MANAAGSANFWVHVETEIARAILQVFPQVINTFTDNWTPWNISSKISIIVHIYMSLIIMAYGCIDFEIKLISFQALWQINGSDVKTTNTMAHQIYVSSKEAYLVCILLADLI